MYRDTLLKQKILGLLEKNHMLQAPQLVTFINESGLDVSKSSVYRDLETLIEQGLIFRQSLGDNEIFYELRKNHHDHLVCLHCNKIESLECHVKIDELPEDFQMEYHNLTVYGKCKDCQSTLTFLSP